jgi:hypothetical protein
MNQRDDNVRRGRELSRLNRFSREPIDSDPDSPGNDSPRDGGEQHCNVGASE